MIWIDTSAYTATFPVYKNDNLIGRIEMEDFANKACTYCYNEQDYKILLTGNSKFLNKLKENIITTNKLEYAEKNEIEVKINEISS